MVAVPETVVNKNAMVVEFLHTAVAEVAVVCFFRPERFTRYAHIVQVEILGHQFVQQLLEVLLRLYIPWVYQSKSIEDNGRAKEKSRNAEASDLPLVFCFGRPVFVACKYKY